VRSASRVPLALSLALASSALLLFWGWHVRDEVYVTARAGPGYVLGILGTTCMTTLLLYSVRKRARFLADAGPLRTWLGIHMMLGILGPVAILFHANFRLGSLNSSVSLACVLLVASSGVIGRLIYPKVHHGLTGRRTTLAEVRAVARSRKNAASATLRDHPPLAAEIDAFERFALTPHGLVGASWNAFVLGRRARAIRRRCQRILRGAGSRDEARRALEALHAYLEAVRRIAEYRIFERFFSLWHAFHLPFCVLLFGAAVVHVIAVHMY
jgi:hypothetical protein